MKDLILYELQKICSKKIVMIAFALLMILNIAMFFGWSVPVEYVWGGEETGYIKGRDAFLIDSQIADEYAGPLTEAKILQILGRFRDEVDLKNRPGMIVNDMFNTINRYFGDGNGLRNDVALSDVQPTKEPLIIGYGYGWSNTLYYVMNIILIGGFLLLIAITPVFSDEYASGADALILSARYGKTKCAQAKIAASFLFSGIVLAILLVLNGVLAGIAFGFKGWECSVQLNRLGIFEEVPYALNYGELCGIAVVLWVLGYMLLTAFSLGLSAVMHTSFLSLIVSTAIYLVPMFIASKALVPLMVLMPIRCSQIYDVVEMELINLGGYSFSYVWIMAVVMIAGSCILGIVARKFFTRHQVTT